jgi:glycosyltransferase involved in cell wall biosynthesis
MKVLYITNALTHYYNLVLSRLNQEESIELVCVSPKVSDSKYAGEGVKVTKDGINFKVIELNVKNFLLFPAFKGLSEVIKSEQPDIIMVVYPYLSAFLFDLKLKRAIKNSNVGILFMHHSHEARSYQSAIDNIKQTTRRFNSLPSIINDIFNLTRFDKLIRYLLLKIEIKSYTLPDAYACYAEAQEILSSYGVEKEKVFIARNSPDTDSLFSTKEIIPTLPKKLSKNQHRVIHLGRLVPWKKVDMLIRAFSIVYCSFPNAELLIIGVGPEKASLERLSKELKLGNSIKFLGGIYDQVELGQYLSESSLYILAGMGGISINDAMCFDLPILCSVCDGTENFLVREGVNGRYFNDGDEQDLIEKITWFFNNVEKSVIMGKASTNIIKNEININTVIKEHVRALKYIENNKLK